MTESIGLKFIGKEGYVLGEGSVEIQGCAVLLRPVKLSKSHKLFEYINEIEKGEMSLDRYIEFITFVLSDNYEIDVDKLKDSIDFADGELLLEKAVVIATGGEKKRMIEEAKAKALLEKKAD
jgi:hypothetical protein